MVESINITEVEKTQEGEEDIDEREEEGEKEDEEEKARYWTHDVEIIFH